jgi:hypothetical protein
VINERGTVRLLTEADVEAIEDARWAARQDRVDGNSISE